MRWHTWSLVVAGGLLAAGLLVAGLLVAAGRALADRSAERSWAERSLTVAMSRDPVVRIGAGSFRMGSDDEDVAYARGLCESAAHPGVLCDAESFRDEQPAHRVQLPAFAIDRTEVTLAAYRRCAAAGRCVPSRVPEGDARMGAPEHPAVLLTAADAEAYCAWVGGRLPSEAEWERAASAGSVRHFPWGNLWNDRLANAAPAPGAQDRDGHAHLAPVGSYRDGASAHGLLDMAGNVWELTADHYVPDAYAAPVRVDPRGPEQGELRVVRGGAYTSPPHLLRVTTRGTVPPAEPRPDVGFRCVYDLRP